MQAPVGLIPPPPNAPGRAGPRRPPRWPWFVGGSLLALVVALVVAREPLLRGLIESKASSMGLTLRFDDVEAGLGEIKITGVRFGLKGQTVLSGEAPSLTFKLGFFRLDRVTAERPKIALTGTIPELTAALSRWRTKHGGDPIDVASDQFTLEGRDTAQSGPWLSVVGSATPTAWGGTLRSSNPQIFGVGIGATIVGWSSNKQALSLWMGEGNGAATHTRLDILPALTPTARLTMRNAPLNSLTQPLGLPSITGATFDAQAEMIFPPGQGMQGKASGALRGLALPGNEWSGLVLGSQTSVATLLVGSPDGRQVQFKNLTVQSGGLAMQGNADLAHQGPAGTFKGRLDGAVPCAMLAQNAATAGLGSVVGGLVGVVANAAIGGNVTISVAFDFATQNPRAGLVQPVIGVGCNLRVP